MKRNHKIIIFILVITIVLATMFLLYQMSVKVKEVTVKNDIISNTTNNSITNTIKNNVVENNFTNEVTNNTNENTNVAEEQKNQTEETNTINPEAKAITIVKKDWGEDSAVYYSNDGITADGKYIVGVRDKQTTTIKYWYYVDVARETFTIKKQ